MQSLEWSVPLVGSSQLEALEQNVMLPRLLNLSAVTERKKRRKFPTRGKEYLRGSFYNVRGLSETSPSKPLCRHSRSRSQGFGSRSFVVSPVSETKSAPGANKLWPKLTTVDSPRIRFHFVGDHYERHSKAADAGIEHQTNIETIRVYNQKMRNRICIFAKYYMLRSILSVTCITP